MENSLNENEEVRLTLADLSHLEGACLYLRRAIVNLPASAVKEKLLFHIDHIVCMDIYSDFEEVKNKIETLQSIMRENNVTAETREHLAYLVDSFQRASEDFLLSQSYT